MKNILHIDAASGLCDLMSNLNDGTNQVVLDIHADTALHPTLEIAGGSIDINFAKRVPVLEEKMKVANHRIDDLEHRKEHSHEE